MVTKKELTHEVDFLTTLRAVLETYEEIAATRMTRIRSTVLRSRDFLFEMNAIFQQVKTSYRAQIDALMKNKRTKDASKFTFIKRNGKTLHLFVSANTGLYGELIRKTFEVFVENLKKEPADVVILGKIGLEMFNDEKIKAPLTYFEFPDNKVDPSLLQKIVEHIIQYEKVLIFYQQFNNVINQSPIITNISGDPLPEQKNQVFQKYFFEPSLEKIMEFFEKEIFAAVFQQTLLESELAKFAVRMVSLDYASENTRTKLKRTVLTKNRLKHQENNKRELEKFASMRLWR
jgi:ATP synthase F1 gamma subunit